MSKCEHSEHEHILRAGAYLVLQVAEQMENWHDLGHEMVPTLNVSNYLCSVAQNIIDKLDFDAIVKGVDLDGDLGVGG